MHYFINVFILNLVLKTTYAPKNIFVHTFSEKLKDVTEKTNIRQFQFIIVN